MNGERITKKSKSAAISLFVTMFKMHEEEVYDGKIYI